MEIINSVSVKKIKNTFEEVKKYCDKYDLSSDEEIAMLYKKLVSDLT
jgi:hypothetical protein